MRIRSLLPAIVAPMALAALSSPAAAQCGTPACNFQTFNLAPNAQLLSVLNCPTVPSAGFHVHLFPVPVGTSAVLLAFATATTGAAGIPIPLGPTTYNILIDPGAFLFTIPAALEPGSTNHWNIQPMIPNSPALLGGFLAIQGIFLNAGAVHLMNRISFTFC